MALVLTLSWASARAADPAPSPDDLRWLERLADGVDTATRSACRALGRKRFLETQEHNIQEAMLGGLFRRMYGLSGDALARIFEGARPKDIGLA